MEGQDSITHIFADCYFLEAGINIGLGWLSLKKLWIDIFGGHLEQMERIRLFLMS